MTAFVYEDAPYAVREDLPVAFREVWHQLAQPGSWWRAADRIAIAAASRDARQCDLCRQRKAALSPNAVAGEHSTPSNLPAAAVDAVHRVTTDPSRLTRSYLDDLAAMGLSSERYVELLGIVVAVISIDAFHRALGLVLEPLPEPCVGEPDGYRPSGLADSGAWVPTVNPAGLGPKEADLYGGAPQTGNVISAMSLVPDSVRMLTTLSQAQYLPAAVVVDPAANGGRSLSRPQIELLAARVSSLSDCFY